jgi:hypothetical protein
MPVVSDKLAYLELPKTASTLIGSVLVDVLGACPLPPKHGRLPPGACAKFVVGSVRNPWDHYVSLWSFGCAGEGQLHARLTHRSFRSAVRQLPATERMKREVMLPTGFWRARYAERTPEGFRRWLRAMHDPSRASQVDPVYGRSRIKFFAGYLTMRYCKLYAADLASTLASQNYTELDSALSRYFVADAMIRMEDLGGDLVTATRAAGYEVDDELERRIRARVGTLLNRSDHRHYSEYYDDAAVELVRRRERAVIERYGYVFEG